MLTGGPGGGKTALINELTRDPAWAGHFAALPETISTMRDFGISSREKLFQSVMANIQMALEDGLVRALGSQNKRIILCNRGSLDPLAYWLDHGWPEQEFFEYTGTPRAKHYQRYTAVIHLVTAADGAQEYYKSWPDAHRSEPIEDAIRLDGLLHQVWRDHSNYHRISNDSRGWPAKARAVRTILGPYLR